MTPERRAWREAMWPAPTAEDWAKPVLLTFQRTWEDAVAVAKEESRPILVCINMDGEIASEHYAGVRYRQPDIAALYEPYVLVIASVYRHNPRDHDDEGRRILCPRFGSVTCGEHIAIEPGIFEKFCDGKRIAPRHILVELDGKETFDVYYRNDTASVFEDIRKAVADRAPLPPRPVRGDRPVLERVASREVRDRSAVEAAYEKSSPEERKALLEAAAKHGEAAQLDLLRLAVFGLDPDLSKAARQALAKADAPAATELVAEALRVPMDAAERDALIATLKRLGDASPLARWLAVVHQGLATRSGSVDAKGWAGPAADGSMPAATLGPDWAGLESKLEFETRAAKSNPADAAALLNLAETTLALAVEAPRTYAAEAWRARLTSRHLFDDARRTALEAERLGAAGWRVNAVVALAAYHGGDLEEAYARAAAAVKDAPPGDTTWASMAVMTVFAEGRFKQIKKAVKEKTDFPPEWLADVNAAYAVLLRHPLGTEGQVIWHYDLLDWLGATDQATAVLREGLRRFGDAPVLHERLRDYLLRKRGPRGLEAYYDGMLKEPGARPALAWYAGAAAAAAAEQARRAGRADAALGAYGRAIALFERAAAADPALKDASDHGVALALAARARVELEQGKDEAAAADAVASLVRRPASAGTADGMSQKPGDTAHTVLARVKAAGRADLAAAIEAALAKVDPDLLIPD
jgi:tetratricopeptide (TPR) repeat protein